MNADYVKIHPVEDEETILKCYHGGFITKETAMHKLWNLPMMTFERLKEIFKECEHWVGDQRNNYDGSWTCLECDQTFYAEREEWEDR